MAVQVPTIDEIRSWPVTVDVRTAGLAFGIGRDQSYRLACEDAFPVPVLRMGRRLRVSRAAVMSLLDIDNGPPSLTTTAKTPDVHAEIDGGSPSR